MATRAKVPVLAVSPLAKFNSTRAALAKVFHSWHEEVVREKKAAMAVELQELQEKMDVKKQNIWTMRKSDLAEILTTKYHWTRQQCDQETAPQLRMFLKKYYHEDKAREVVENPRAVAPKGLHDLKKAILIEEVTKRGLAMKGTENRQELIRLVLDDVHVHQDTAAETREKEQSVNVNTRGSRPTGSAPAVEPVRGSKPTGSASVVETVIFKLDPDIEMETPWEKIDLPDDIYPLSFRPWEGPSEGASVSARVHGPVAASEPAAITLLTEVHQLLATGTPVEEVQNLMKLRLQHGLDTRELQVAVAQALPAMMAPGPATPRTAPREVAAEALKSQGRPNL